MPKKVAKEEKEVKPLVVRKQERKTKIISE